ncbi:MAG: hypothetical protein QOI41_4228, partial [Myxococcales bacterium]|nr:hypothetical protein [Myxococcales bacterium]
MLSARTNSSLSALALGLALVLFAGTVQAQ